MVEGASLENWNTGNRIGGSNPSLSASPLRSGPETWVTQRTDYIASTEYVEVLHQHGMLLSMSRAGNPYDNATCESWIKTLKVEEIYGNQYQDL